LFDLPQRHHGVEASLGREPVLVALSGIRLERLRDFGNVCSALGAWRDIILETGDIVSIEGREREVFYTRGMLGAGEHQLPRDYDLDVIAAMSLVGSGGPLTLQGGGGGYRGGFGAGMVGGVPPGQVYIMRKTSCGDQITIAVDMVRALRDPRSRALVHAGDMLWLQYKPTEEILNFGLGAFFTYGIADLLRSNR